MNEILEMFIHDSGATKSEKITILNAYLSSIEGQIKALNEKKKLLEEVKKVVEEDRV